MNGTGMTDKAATLTSVKSVQIPIRQTPSPSPSQSAPSQSQDASTSTSALAHTSAAVLPAPTSSRPQRAAKEIAAGKLRTISLSIAKPSAVIISDAITAPSRSKRKESDGNDSSDSDDRPRVKRQRVKSEIGATSETIEEEDFASTKRRLVRRSSNPNSIASRFTLSANLYTTSCRALARQDDTSQLCSCVIPTDGSLACGDNCINAQLRTECSPDCLTGAKCGNQRFARRQYAPVEVRDVGLKGHGLFSKELIKAGSFIIEYVGEVR